MSIPRLLPLILITSLLLSMAAISVADDKVSQERLRALSAAVAALGQPAKQGDPAVAQVCWTPHGEFSPAGVTSAVPYGPIGLAAQYVYGTVTTERQIKAVWKYNKSSAPMSTGDCTMLTTASSVANGLLKSAGPLLPGLYEVTFMDGNQTLASGMITIQQPVNLGQRSVEEVYAEALKEVDTAVREVDASRAALAAKSAEKALPLLSAVIMARPKDNDATALYELAQAIVGVGKMEALAPKNVPDLVLDWGMRSFAHATLSATIAKDASLKSKAQQYADVLQKAIPQMAAAAASAAKKR